MIGYEQNIDGWTVYTTVEEVKAGGKTFYAGRGTAEFRAPQRNQGQWKSVDKLTYPNGSGQELCETQSHAHEKALESLKEQIDAQRQ